MRRKRRDQVVIFVNQLAALRFDSVFNPYSQTCPYHGGDNAALVRCRNLRIVLEAALNSGVHSFWIARDLGYRGGRRTGLALTDEVHLAAHGGLYGDLPLARATRGPAVAERPATTIGQGVRNLDRPGFLLNSCPF